MQNSKHKLKILLLSLIVIAATTFSGAKPMLAGDLNTAYVNLSPGAASVALDELSWTFTIDTTIGTHGYTGAKDAQLKINFPDSFDATGTAAAAADIVLKHYDGATLTTLQRGNGGPSDVYQIVSAAWTSDAGKYHELIIELDIIEEALWFSTGDIIIVEVTANGANTLLPTNPTAGNYDVELSTTDGSGVVQDTSTVKIPIITAVNNTAKINDNLAVVISEDNTCGSRTSSYTQDEQNIVSATEINWGDESGGGATGGNGNGTKGSGYLSIDKDYIACHEIKVTTNSAYGYETFLGSDGDFQNTVGNTIDMMPDVVNTDSEAACVAASDPSSCEDQAWNAPSGTTGSPETYGHIAYGTTDEDTFGSGHGADNFASISTDPTGSAVASSNAPVNQETTVVEYKLRVTGLQEAGNYTQVLYYSVVPRY